MGSASNHSALWQDGGREATRGSLAAWEGYPILPNDPWLAWGAHTACQQVSIRWRVCSPDPAWNVHPALRNLLKTEKRWYLARHKNAWYDGTSWSSSTKESVGFAPYSWSPVSSWLVFLLFYFLSWLLILLPRKGGCFSEKGLELVFASSSSDCNYIDCIGSSFYTMLYSLYTTFYFLYLIKILLWNYCWVCIF